MSSQWPTSLQTFSNRNNWLSKGSHSVTPSQSPKHHKHPTEENSSWPSEGSHSVMPSQSPKHPTAAGPMKVFTQWCHLSLPNTLKIQQQRIAGPVKVLTQWCLLSLRLIDWLIAWLIDCFKSSYQSPKHHKHPTVKNSWPSSLHWWLQSAVHQTLQTSSKSIWPSAGSQHWRLLGLPNTPHPSHQEQLAQWRFSVMPSQCPRSPQTFNNRNNWLREGSHCCLLSPPPPARREDDIRVDIL